MPPDRRTPPPGTHRPSYPAPWPDTPERRRRARQLAQQLARVYLRGGDSRVVDLADHLAHTARQYGRQG